LVGKELERAASTGFTVLLDKAIHQTLLVHLCDHRGPPIHINENCLVRTIRAASVRLRRRDLYVLEVLLKVLLAIDNSKFSEAATQTLTAQFRPKETEVRVLHVIELYPLFPVGKQLGPELAVASEEHRHQAGALVASAAKALRNAGFDRVTTAVEQGNPKVAILDSAAEWEVDLIILGSHGEKDWTRFLMGSVSEAVVRHAQCSVQVVRIRPGL